MKTALKIIAVVGVLFVIMAAIIFVWIDGPESLSRRKHFNSLVKTNDHETVVRTAIDLIGATTNPMQFIGTDITNLPPPIAKMKPSYVLVTVDSMTIEFHGGFDHFGFEIESHDDFWEMTRYSERSRHSMLMIRKNDKSAAPGTPLNFKLSVTNAH